MPAKKKEPKVEEPVFVDETGSYVHEQQCARYVGGIRRYTAPAETQTAAPTKGAAAAAAAAAAAKRAEEEASHGGASPSALVYRHGRGTYSSPQLEYSGTWVEDVMEGEGRLHFRQTGSVYTGGFLRGMFEGAGVYVWADGSSYDGQWRSNRMHGEGTYTDVDGNVWRGTFFHGTGPGLERIYKDAAAALRQGADGGSPRATAAV